MLKFSKISLILSLFISAYPAFCSCVGLGFGSDVLILYVDVVRSSNTSSDCLVKGGGLLSVISALRLRGGTLSRGWNSGRLDLTGYSYPSAGSRGHIGESCDRLHPVILGLNTFALSVTLLSDIRHRCTVASISVPSVILRSRRSSACIATIVLGGMVTLIPKAL